MLNIIRLNNNLEAVALAFRVVIYLAHGYQTIPHAQEESISTLVSEKGRQFLRYRSEPGIGVLKRGSMRQHKESDGQSQESDG